MWDPNFVIQVGSIIGGVVILVVILVFSQGRGRLLGTIGVGLIIINSAGSMVFSWVYADLLSQVATSDLPPVLILNSVVQTALYGGGVILLGLAVDSSRRIQRAPILPQ